jgi:hypothetical protein
MGTTQDRTAADRLMEAEKEMTKKLRAKGQKPVPSWGESRTKRQKEMDAAAAAAIWSRGLDQARQRSVPRRGGLLRTDRQKEKDAAEAAAWSRGCARGRESLARARLGQRTRELGEGNGGRAVATEHDSDDDLSTMLETFDEESEEGEEGEGEEGKEDLYTFAGKFIVYVGNIYSLGCVCVVLCFAVCWNLLCYSICFIVMSCVGYFDANIAFLDVAQGLLALASARTRLRPIFSSRRWPHSFVPRSVTLLPSGDTLQPCPRRAIRTTTTTTPRSWSWTRTRTWTRTTKASATRTIPLPLPLRMSESRKSGHAMKMKSAWCRKFSQIYISICCVC